MSRCLSPTESLFPTESPVSGLERSFSEGFPSLFGISSLTIQRRPKVLSVLGTDDTQRPKGLKLALADISNRIRTRWSDLTHTKRSTMSFYHKKQLSKSLVLFDIWPMTWTSRSKTWNGSKPSTISLGTRTRTTTLPYFEALSEPSPDSHNT